MPATKSTRKPAAKAQPKSPAKPRTARGDLAPERIAAILKGLDEAYPAVECALIHSSPWELLVATILSAQCTDVRVNLVTPELFKRFPTPAAMAKATLPQLEALIRTTGFFHNKAKSIQGAARKIVSEFNNQVPQTLAELVTIPGAARKTANVVLGVCFGKAEGVVVDTHVFRIARRLGLAKGDTAPKVEQELMKVIPQDRWIDFSHQIIHHGRQVCDARKPKCDRCNLEQLCHSQDKTWSS
jgi:endonuclease-3